MDTTAPPPGLPEQFDALTKELRALQRELDAMYSALSRGPDAGAEARAAALREKRAALFERWGMAALTWVARGGAVRLAAGDSPALVPVTAPLAELEEEAQTEEIGERVDLDWLEEEDAAEIDEGMTEEIPAGELDLARLREAVLAPRWSHQKAPSAPSFDPTELAALRERVGPPVPITGASQGNAELDRVAKELNNLDRWRVYPRSVQRALVGIFAARLRHLQDECAVRKSIDARKLSTAFPHLTRFSDEARPGFVKGLSRGQDPEHGSWVDDARVWWDALQAELEAPQAPARRPGAPNADRALDGIRKMVEGGSPNPQALRSAAILALDAGLPADNAGLIRSLKPHLTDLEGDGRLKSLRRSIRQALAADAEADADVAAAGSVIPADWPHLDRTRGKVAVMVGGDLREQSRAAIQEALGFESLAWESGYDVRSVQALAARIERGGLGFVIFLRRFISHKMTDILLPACKASGVAWVMVDQGYGLTRVKLGIERYLSDASTATQGQ